MSKDVYTKIYQAFSLTLVVGVTGMLFTLFFMTPNANALPEYGNRTGESCAGCHVSPGGGGPLTLGGMSWVADDRPDTVGEFDAVLLAPGLYDPADLYEIACAGCHGTLGEGLSSTALVGFDFSKRYLRRTILEGLPYFNMPGFEGKFTDEQAEYLAAYVSDLSAGRLVPQTSYPLPPGELTCIAFSSLSTCGGN